MSPSPKTPIQWGRHICACEHCEARDRGEYGPTLKEELDCKASQIADAIEASKVDTHTHWYPLGGSVTTACLLPAGTPGNTSGEGIDCQICVEACKRETAARVEGRLQIAKCVGGIQLRLAASRIERYPGYSPRDLTILLETIEQLYAQGSG